MSREAQSESLGVWFGWFRGLALLQIALLVAFSVWLVMHFAGLVPSPLGADREVAVREVGIVKIKLTMQGAAVDPEGWAAKIALSCLAASVAFFVTLWVLNMRLLAQLKAWRDPEVRSITDFTTFWYLVPIANLIMPVLVLRRIWRATVRMRGVATGGIGLLVAGWLAFLGAEAAPALSVHVFEEPAPSALTLMGVACHVAALALAIVVYGRLVAFHRAQLSEPDWTAAA